MKDSIKEKTAAAGAKTKGQESKAKECVTKFMQAWKKGSYEGMYLNCQQTWCSRHPWEDLKIIFPYKISQYRVTDVVMQSPVMYDFMLRIVYQGKKETYVLRALCETEPFKPDVEGEFGVNPISVKPLSVATKSNKKPVSKDGEE